MTLIRRPQHFSPFDALLKSNFNDLPYNWVKNDECSFTPAVNIQENDKDYSISVAAPGFNKDQFKVLLKDNLLSISAEVKESKKENTKSYTLKEFSSKSFNRSFTVPEGKVDEAKISANYKDGVLDIRLPKLEEAKSKTHMEIQIS